MFYYKETLFKAIWNVIVHETKEGLFDKHLYIVLKTTSQGILYALFPHLGHQTLSRTAQKSANFDFKK
jgi:hypothetical protein